MKTEDIQKEIKKNTRLVQRIQTALIIIFIATVLLVLFSLTSCTTTKFVPVEKIKTVYRNNTDTIREQELVHDSISSYTEAHGDTIFKYITHWRRKYLIKWEMGTNYVYQHDSIPYPVIQQVEKKLTLCQRIKQDLGGLSIFALLGVFLYYAIKLGIKRLKGHI